jgi:hypothetical protein
MNSVDDSAPHQDVWVHRVRPEHSVALEEAREPWS